MKLLNTLLVVLLPALTSIASMAVAEPLAPPPPPPPPPAPELMPGVPPAPPGVQSGQMLEPGVRIIQTEKETVFEYRNGPHLYMVKVIPRGGRPYYFFDSNGDGQLDYQENDPRAARINQWTLFTW